MAAKDRFTCGLKCQKCGQEGEIDLIENDYPFTPPETRIERISEGFHAVQRGDTSNTINVVCRACGTDLGFEKS